MHILVSIFCSNIKQTSGTYYDLHRALSWAKREEFFFFHFFCKIFFGGQVFRSDMKCLIKNLQK